MPGTRLRPLALLLCTAALQACAWDDACAGCTIVRTVGVSLNVPGHALPARSGVTLTSTGSYLIAAGTSVVELGADGRVVGTLPLSANDSAAPTATAVAALGTDSLIVVDTNAGVLRIYGPARVVTGIVKLPPDVRIETLRILQWPGRLLLTGRVLGRRGLFRASVKRGFLVIDRDYTLTDDEGTGAYRLTHPDRGRMWAVEAGSNTLLELDDRGDVVRRTKRQPDWFDTNRRGLPGGRLRTSVSALVLDDEQRIWIYATVPTDTAAVAWRTREARRAGGTVPLAYDELYETVVEVLDATGSTLLARGRVPAYLAGVLPDGRAIFTQRRGDAENVSAAGTDAGARFTVQTLRLTGAEIR